MEWSVRRSLSKTNYKIHNNSIKENLLPLLTDNQKQFIYKDEADVLNVVLFGITAKEWRKNKPSLTGNIRDYPDILHLVVLSNLEVLNSEMIDEGIQKKIRLEKLNKIAIKQLSILYYDNNIQRIENISKYSIKGVNYD